MILLNKFIQCLRKYVPYNYNYILFNPSYMSGCLVNSIILYRAHQNIIFNSFGTINCGFYKIIKLFINRVLRGLIFQKNGYVEQFEIYRNGAQKIVCCTNYAFNFIDTDRDIKDILSSIYG